MSHSTPGVRHARATRSAFALRPGPFKVYMALRYLIADGATVDITQAEIATVADVSESTVNTAVRELAADDDTPGLITLERVARTDVRGTRWQITMHAPPELVASSGAWHGSAADRPTPAPVQPVRAPQTAPAEGSATDRHEDHDQYLQQQQDRAPTAPALNRDQQLLYTALRAHPTIGHTVAMRLITQYPDRTPDDFARDLRNADRPGVKNPLAVTLHCWLDGAAVWEPRTPTEAPNGPRASGSHRRDRVRRRDRAAHPAPATAGGAATGGGRMAEHAGPGGDDHAAAAAAPELDLAAIYAEAAERLRRAQERRC